MSFAILIDMNLSPAWVDWFEEQGWPAVHWSAVGDPRSTDRVILAWAREHGRVLFTHDLDFSAVLVSSNDSSPMRHPTPRQRRDARWSRAVDPGGLDLVGNRAAAGCARERGRDQTPRSHSAAARRLVDSRPSLGMRDCLAPRETGPRLRGFRRWTTLSGFKSLPPSQISHQLPVRGHAEVTT